MPLPKLALIQSLITVRIVILVLLITIYFCISNPQFAYAADVDSVANWDHNHLLSFDLQHQTEDRDSQEWYNNEGSSTYESSFAGIDRSIIGRAPDGIGDLPNNVPGRLNINPGETQYWTVSNATLWGALSPLTPGLPSSLKERRGGWGLRDTDERTWDDSRILHVDDPSAIETIKRQNAPANPPTLYITLNTCLQPTSKSTDKIPVPPQLRLYISQSQSNKKPGPGAADKVQQSLVIAVEGFANISINATADVYIGVEAPVAPDFTDSYNYELAASIDAPYHSYNDSDSNLHLIDSDTNSALFITSNLTNTEPTDPIYQERVSNPPPFIIFAHNQNDSKILGLQNSYCGLKNNAHIAAYKDGRNTHNVEVGITTNRGLGNKPKEQFYITSLNGSSAYYGFLAMQGNSTLEGPGVVRGGGKVWKHQEFETKSDGNCQVIFNLTFCSEVAYAVPSNPRTFPNITELTKLYDDHALALYKNFSYSLQQIACDTTSSARYSLVRNCTDCDHAYRQWLCAVAIPRCHDFSSSLPFLQPRNIAQDSVNKTRLERNGLINTKIRPGPYKEVLPCRDLCYNLVRSCPAALGFGCPSEAMGLNRSYGTKDPSGNIVTCSFLGAASYQNQGTTPRAPGIGISAAVTFIVLSLLLS